MLSQREVYLRSAALVGRGNTVETVTPLYAEHAEHGQV